MPYRDPERQAASDRRGARKYWAKVKALLTEAKAKPCVDCGQIYPPWVMDFDHLQDKKYGIGKMGSSPLALYRVEIAKCDVVCSNCHRQRTHDRLIPGA